MLFIKILQNIIQPSFFPFVIIIIGLILIYKRPNKQIGLALAIIGIVSFYLFSISLVADGLIGQLENRFKTASENNIDVSKLVLLTGDKESNILRAVEAILLYRQFKDSSTPLQIIISGINPITTNAHEELVELKQHLLNNEIPAEQITIDDQSRTTWESAKNLDSFVGQNKFYLVTSAYHLPRSMEVFLKNHLNPIPRPTDIKTKKRYNLFDLLPSGDSLRKSDLASHEYFGILFYKIKYLFNN